MIRDARVRNWRSEMLISHSWGQGVDKCEDIPFHLGFLANAHNLWC